MTQISAAPEVKFCALDLKRVQEDGAFAGYASLFNREDLGRDIVVPGAFRESLARRGPSGIRMLFQHDPNQPIGVWDEIKEDARGLHVRGRLTRDVARAREVLSLMRAGALDGLSIGFRAGKGRRDRRTGVRRLTKIDLWEISIVTFPMLPGARVESVKATPCRGAPFKGRLPTQRELERWLTRDAGLTRSEAAAVMRLGFKGLNDRRDAAGALGEEALLARQIRRAARFMRCN